MKTLIKLNKETVVNQFYNSTMWDNHFASLDKSVWVPIEYFFHAIKGDNLKRLEVNEEMVAFEAIVEGDYIHFFAMKDGMVSISKGEETPEENFNGEFTKEFFEGLPFKYSMWLYRTVGALRNSALKYYDELGGEQTFSIRDIHEGFDRAHFVENKRITRLVDEVFASSAHGDSVEFLKNDGVLQMRGKRPSEDGVFTFLTSKAGDLSDAREVRYEKGKGVTSIMHIGNPEKVQELVELLNERVTEFYGYRHQF